MEIILNNYQNTLITGPPGSGKTYTINNLIDYFKDNYIEYAATASTGIASTLFNGVTINSWSGINMFKRKYSVDKDITNEYFLRKIKKKYFAVKRIRNVEYLIIDEISLISDKFFECLEYVCRMLRSPSKSVEENPFGGIKTIIVGDFYQLPPVHDNYCFESNIFKKIYHHTILLNKNYRVKDSVIFHKLLLNIRENIKLTKQQLDLIKSRIPQKKSKGKYIYPSLVSLKNTSKLINMKKLKKNKNTLFTFNAIINGPEFIIKQTNLEKVLLLKKGCPVIYLKNSPELQIYNGSVGYIDSILEDSIKVRFDNNIIEIQPHTTEIIDDSDNINSITQIPLSLAFAITIHKSQGQTLSQGSILLDNTIFASGQAYVALSRFTNLNNVNILKFDNDVFKVDKKVQQFYLEYS
tara:strand:- start:2295 stop:3521 length:1227 start_codon:yes stop_codon:yes gene_type:complete